MKPPVCPRVWEAEALEDRRLGDADRESFERHLTRCLECRRALSDLEAVRETMRALPVRSQTPIARHRVRASILREANRHVTHAPLARRAPMFAAVALLGVGALLLASHWRAKPSTPAPPSASIAAGPLFHVAPEAAARWNIRASGAATVVALEEGRVAFKVAHLEPGQRFSVALPDGEVEVHGTQFVVDVAVNRTKSVTVSSGTVALRLGGQNELMLLAGDRWTSPVIDEPAVPDGGSREAASIASHPTHATLQRPIVAGAAERFDDAMSRFSAGQFGDADTRFASFIHDYPTDSRCEDAAFLRAVARSQLGDTEGAATLAVKYLRAYPEGLRRAEAQHLIDADER